MLPKVAVKVVPAVIEVPADILVPAARVVPEARVVVVVNDPGVVIAEGRETVAVVPTVVTVIWLAVPKTTSTVPIELPSCTQVALLTPPAVERATSV